MIDQRFAEDPHGGRQKPGSAVHASPEIKKATFKFGLGRDSEIPGVRRYESISNPEEARANDVMKRLNAGEIVDPRLAYFRTVPKFETTAPGLQWMTRSVFVVVGERSPNEVIVRFYRLE